MAFSFRKMFSNITYFKKSDAESENDSSPKARRHTYVDEPIVINFESLEPDSTSRQCTSLNLPDSVKNFAAKKGSLSDTDLLTLSIEVPRRQKIRKCKKLKLDIKKASQSMNQLSEDSNVENTPKHVLLQCKTSDAFERFRGFDFNKSFDFSDEYTSSPIDEDIDIDSLSDQSDSDVSIASNKSVKMCRKVTSQMDENHFGESQLVPSASLESFGDVELDKNEEERVKLLLAYQMKLEKMECVLKTLLNEFQFHIEVSKLFRSKSVVTALPGADISNLPLNLGHVKYINSLNERGVSPNSWNVVMEKEDSQTKYKFKKRLLSMKNNIDDFVRIYLQNYNEKSKSITYFDVDNNRSRRLSINHKKKIKHFDFPDLREAMINLFSINNDIDETDKEISYIDNKNTEDTHTDNKCSCKCHLSSTPSTPDSGVTKNDGSSSITSSIGNFTLDSSTLTAYSESLDQIISYNSFEDSSLYNTLLQKAAMERITFYVQVHSIQLKCETNEFEAKNTITFHCPPCKDTQNEENGLLRHILSQTHCEKIHFLYKTAYIKKCVSAGKEIQPSTVLNPMKMYRDDNKIVCFGDAIYACSLCFENLIVGESVLMAHCSQPEHVDRREKLNDIIG